MKVKEFLNKNMFKNEIIGKIIPLDNPTSFWLYKKGKVDNRCPYLNSQIIKVEIDFKTYTPIIYVEKYQKILDKNPPNMI